MATANLEQFERRIGVVFQDKNILLHALTHRSYVNENPKWTLGHNERLEFLGDAVIELAVTKYLFTKYPKKPEGELTNYRASLVNTDMLADVARTLDFNGYILLSRGEAKDVGRARNNILANTFEAVIGAIYLDQGYNAAERLLRSVLYPRITDIVARRLWKDPKSAFQEAAQEREGTTPTYRVLKEEGPDHDKQFIVGVFLGANVIAEGTGSSKQEAETKAAEKGLKEKKWE